MDWKALELEIIEASQRAVEKWLKKYRKHHAYAFAFHESYRELDAQIAFPFLGVNSIEFLKRQQETDEVELEWNPAEWYTENVLSIRSMHKWEGLVCDAALGGTQAQWYRIEKKFIAMLVRVAKALRKTFAKHPQVTSDFVVYFDDEDGGIDLIKKCVPKRLFEKHFSEYDEESLEGLSQKEKLQKYWTEPWMYEKEIIALGEAAIEPLLEMLSTKNGGTAACLFDDLGLRNSKVRDALRSEVEKVDSMGVAESSARTLFFQGDSEFLFKMVGRKKSRNPAVRGIVAGIKLSASKRKDPLPLDYRPVEELLALRTSQITNLVKSELEPGSSFIEIKPTDVDEAIRGLESKQAVIRQHAVSILGERKLGKTTGKRVLPELAKCLYDKVPNVRRLTLLSLIYWKGAAKPYHEEMKKLQKQDSDSDVRFWASYVFDM